MILQTLNADAFYAERDSRAGMEHPLAQLPTRRIAIVVPPDAAPEVGLEIGLFWTASMVRRMGRAFSEVILVASAEFRASKCRMAGSDGASVEQVVGEELRSADPFARVEWRTFAENMELSDASSVIWLGTPPLALQLPNVLAINAHGWIASLNQPPLGELSLIPADFDATPAAIVMAASMAAARIFANEFSPQQRASQVALALDSWTVTSDESVAAAWVGRGATLVDPIPWSGEKGTEKQLGHALFVSAGGICGNICRILRDTFLRIGSAYVIDPDVLDLTNLNRSIGIGISAVGTSKATLAVESLQLICDSASALHSSYEAWSSADRMEPFRKTDSAVIIGVDQVRTRLVVGSDWPWTLVNGATSGGTFSAGVHARAEGGCIGCWYGLDDAPFAATRTPMACAAGVSGGIAEPRPAASYGFVSVAAAATMAAALVRLAYEPGTLKNYAGTVTSMSLRTPERAQSRRVAINNRCLLLCSEPYLQEVLDRSGGSEQ